MEEYKLMIGGKWVDGEEMREIKSPYDGSAVAKVHFAGKEQVEEAVGAAHEAFEVTKKLSSFDRAEVLEYISSKIDERSEELAVSITKSSGKAINSARVEASVLRPASQTSVTSMILADIIKESGYPSGGFNAVPCGYKAADVLVEDERVKKITFTGSPDIGWELKKRANKKRVTLELGGNAAVVIEPDANLEFALPRMLMGAYSYSGQVCISIQRIFLHTKIYDKFMADFVEATKKLKMGDPMDEKTDVGPMINLGAAEQIEEWMNEAVENGARIVCGGGRDGAMVEPTILEKVRPELRISWLEAFAPIVVVYPYKNFDKALKEVNNSKYGLQAGVFTSDINKAFQAYEILDVGGVIVNDIPTFRIDHMPYGGIKESGFGREGLKYAIEEMTEMKLMAINLNI